jgi:hypothetical protein
MSYRGKHRAPDPRLVRARQVARAGGGATLIAVLAAALALTASTGSVGGSASRNPRVHHAVQQPRAVTHKVYALVASTPLVAARPEVRPWRR